MMSGAAMWIPESALPRFCGKRVRLFIDGDKAGRTGAKKFFTSCTKLLRISTATNFPVLFKQTSNRLKT
jgi:hypothetical protein